MLTQDHSALVNFMGVLWFMAGRRAKLAKPFIDPG